ncbi:MAG: HAD family hydrolase [Actinomycetes bacterium]
MTASADLVVGFDLDMTLIDSRPGVAATFAELNRVLGTAIPGHELSERLGPTLEMEMAAFFPPEEIPAVCDRYREIYATVGAAGCSRLPGAAAALEAVTALGGRTLVVTAKFEPNARRCLATVDLRVDHVVGWRHGPHKGETLLEHGALAYVGDTPPDIEAARVADAIAVAVASGPWTAAELGAHGADVVLGSLLEFPAWLAAALDA